MADTTSTRMKVAPILAAITSSMKPVNIRAEHSSLQAPFVTISREAGLGGPKLADRLVDAVNRRDPSDRPWQVFDRELVEKVAEDHHISQSLIDAVAESNHSWINDVLAGMKGTSRTESTQFNVYRRVAETVIGLAEAGKVVVVGRGGANITQTMPGGMRVRVVAPLDYRVKLFASTQNVSRSEAERRVRDLEENRRSFFTRFWGKDALDPDSYTVVFNAARVSQEQMVEAMLALIPKSV